MNYPSKLFIVAEGEAAKFLHNEWKREENDESN